jgi:hypothetical protein
MGRICHKVGVWWWYNFSKVFFGIFLFLSQGGRVVVV